MIVPNQFPTSNTPHRLAIIGESPGAEEDRCGKPFMGQSGQKLDELLGRAGILRSECFVGNICQQHPPGNELMALGGWSSAPVQQGLQKLREDMWKFKPNVVLLLGNYALKAAKDPTVWKIQYKVSEWRGSVFQAQDPLSPFRGLKCLPSYHPAFCLRDYANMPFLMLDIRKAGVQRTFPEVRQRPRLVQVPDYVSEALKALDAFRQQRLSTAYDIEGYWNDLKCIGFSNHPESALVIPFRHLDGRPYWGRSDEPLAWRAVAELLEDSAVPKIAQAGLYDRFCLHYGYGMRVRGTVDDTMNLHWSLYSELARDAEKKGGRKGMGLAIQLSIYTDMPYYKSMRKTESDQEFWTYCGYDCMGTKEVEENIKAILDGPGDPRTFTKDEFDSMKGLYKNVMQVTNAFLYMELKGIRYDTAKAQARVAILKRKLWETQARFNYLAGTGFTWKSKAEINKRIRELMFTKKGDRVYKDYEEPIKRVKELLRTPNPNLATIGELETLCEIGCNIESSKQSNIFFYDQIKMPEQTNEDQHGKQVRTTDYEALLKLSRVCQQEPKFKQCLPLIECAIELRALSTRIGMLEISADRDGRIRCGYNVVGSNTGRVTCYESPTGSGYNLQTIPNYTDSRMAPGSILGDRDLFIADLDYWFFQCDLKGADGWTVAAYSAMLGDPTMLDDYKTGVSPFERLTLKLLGIPIPTDRGELKATIKKHVEKDGWPRFLCKRVQHGGCYLEGPNTVARNALKDSEGKLYVAPSECAALLRFMLDEMYPGVRRYHDFIQRRMSARPVLKAASGQVRQFFGRRDEIITKAVAFEPQANTTYATNLAAARLWNDPDNRLLPGSVHNEQTNKNEMGSERQSVHLRVQPLHQVHDALCGQFPKADTRWSVERIASYFDNSIIIANQPITIPFDGGYGPSWGSLREGTISLGKQLNLTPHENNPNTEARSGIDRRM
jgi:uracil-DNA glycosylase family 4